MSRVNHPNKISVFFGLEKDRDNRPIDPAVRANAVTRIRRLAAEAFGGYSAFTGAGGWINEAGELVEEATLRLDIYSEKGYPEVHDFAQKGGALLRQASVLADFNAVPHFVDIEPEDHYGEIKLVTPTQSHIH